MAEKTVTPKRRASKPGSSGRGNSTRNGAPVARSRPKIVVEDLADFNESINFLVYGDSGVGKSPFCAMAPRAVILSTEKGSISAKRFGSTARLIRAFDWVTVEAALDYIDEHPGEFDWMIVDSMTKMQFLLLRHLLGINVEENRKNADIDLPQLQDHQKWQNMFKRFVDRIIDMNINTIFIATSMHKEDAEGDDLVLPDVQGKDYAIAQYVCAQMDGVYCLKVVSPKDKDDAPYWRLLTQSKPPYFAKDRYRALPRVIEYPYMPKIIELIETSIGDGQPLFPPDMMRGISAPERTIVIDPGDIEHVEEDEDEPEEPPKPTRRRSGTRTTRTGAKPARRQTRRSGPVKSDEPDEDEDEAEEAQETLAKEEYADRKTRRRRKARRPEPEPDAEEDEDDEDDEDDFDPDDEIDLEDEG